MLFSDDPQIDRRRALQTATSVTFRKIRADNDPHSWKARITWPDDKGAGTLFVEVSAGTLYDLMIWVAERVKKPGA